MVLRIPDDGLRLESSAHTMATLPAQAFAISLNDSIIEDMIECVQNGQGIKLSLGDNPTFTYGSSRHRISKTPSLSAYDLFLTDPTDPFKKADRLPNPTMSLFKNPALNGRGGKNLKPKVARRVVEGPKEKEAKTPQSTPLDVKVSDSKGVAEWQDAVDLGDAVAQLSSALAQREAEKKENATRIVEGLLPSTKRGARKPGKSMLTGNGSSFTAASQSLPASPALSGVGSPSLAPSLSASQKASEKTKQARSPILHELAFKEQTYDNLWQKYPGDSENDFKIALEKVADLDGESGNYVLRKMYWRELDVFNHEYASEEERQQAIDNAIRQFDRMRLTPSDPEWQKLLPKEERNKGKCLSKVHANILRGPPPAPAPKIKVQKAEESSAESGSSKDDGKSRKSAKGGEAMVRSTSQPQAPPKPKKPAAAPEKRWLSNKKATTPKISPTKPTPKTVAVANDKAGGKFKSKEFVSDSDSSDNESAPLSSTVPQSKLAKKPVGKPVKKVAAPRPRPVVKETIKPQITAKPPMKRPREDDDSSSSSGTPLSKRFKGKETKPKPAPVQSQNYRNSDASQNSRGTSSGNSFAKSKNTSPAKSSPLASSPPTNASDMDPAENGYASKKRKADTDSDSRVKRQRLSEGVVRKAFAFKKFYEKYETLHNEMKQLENPPEDKVADLIDMRERLQVLKSQIYQEVPAQS